jgi:hypothetical protein
MTPVTDDAVPVKWEDSIELNADACDLEKETEAAGASFAELPGPAAKPKNYDAWKKAFLTWIYTTQRIELLKSPSSRRISQPGESERDFRARLDQAAREERDAAVEELRRKYAPKLASIEEKIRRAEQARQREQEQSSAQKVQAALGVGGAILGAFFGRKTLSRTNITAAASAARTIGRTYKEGQDVNRAGETVEALQQQYAALEQQFQQDTQELQSRIDPSKEELEKVTVRPKKTNITPRLFTLVWAPYRGDQPAWE